MLQPTELLGFLHDCGLLLLCLHRVLSPGPCRTPLLKSVQQLLASELPDAPVSSVPVPCVLHSVSVNLRKLPSQ